MAQPTVEQVWHDPDFQGLPIDEKRKVLTSIDPDFSALPATEQDKVLSVHTLTSAVNRPAENTGLQNVADKLSGMLSRVNNPGGPNATGGATPLEPGGNDMFRRMGESVAASMPNHPLIGAGLGTAVSMANPENWLTPAEGVSAQIVKPAAPLPANEAASGVPFTRPEISQSPITLGLQSRVQASPTGGLELNPFKAAQAAKLDAFQKALQDKLGTSESASVTGNQIRDSAIKEQAANKAVSDANYAAVPKDVRLPVVELGHTFQTLADELPKHISDLITKHTSLGNPVSDVTGSATTAGGVTSASPNPAPTINTTVDLQSLVTLRSKLTALQSEGGLNGMYATVLKKALNNDITNMATMDQSPLGQVMGASARNSLDTATNYYREMMSLQNHPVAKALQGARIEDLPDIAFKGGRAEDVQVARAYLGEPGFQAAQKSFFSDLLNKKDISKELAKYDPEFVHQALSSDQLQALQTLDALKKRVMSAGSAEPMAGSSKMNMWLALLTGMAKSPLKTLVTGGALPYAAAKMMTNTAGITARMGPALTTGVMGASGNVAPRTPLDVLRHYIKQQPGR